MTLLCVLALTPAVPVLRDGHQSALVLRAWRLQREGRRAFAGFLAPACPWLWRARRLRWASSGGGQSALAVAFRRCALAVALGSLVPVATLVCVTWFAGACAYACGLFVCRRRFEVQAAMARVCVGILARALHTLLE